MGKYKPLTRYLENLDRESWEAQFADVEQILGFELPRSAHAYPAWWANQDGTHSQTRGWQDAGWETCNVDLAAKRLRFAKRQKPSISQTRAVAPVSDLFAKAMAMTGITDRRKLEMEALKALIQREAASYLASLGGTMPDAQAAPRRRLD